MVYTFRGTDVQVQKTKRKVKRLVEVLDAIKVSVFHYLHTLSARPSSYILEGLVHTNALNVMCFSVNLMSIVLLQDINLGQLAEEVSHTIVEGGELPSTRDVAEQVSHICMWSCV